MITFIISLLLLSQSNYSYGQYYGQNLVLKKIVKTASDLKKESKNKNKIVSKSEKIQGEIQELYYFDYSNYLQIKIKSDKGKDYDFWLNPKIFKRLPNLSLGDKVSIEFVSEQQKIKINTIKTKYFKIENKNERESKYTTYQISSVFNLKNGILLNLMTQKDLNIKFYRAKFIGDAYRWIQSLNVNEKGTISLDLPDMQRKNVFTYLYAERIGDYVAAKDGKKEKILNQVFRGKVSDLYYFRTKKENEDRISFLLEIENKVLTFSLTNLIAENKLKPISPLSNGMEIEVIVKLSERYYRKDYVDKEFRLQANEYELRSINNNSLLKQKNENLKGIVKYIKFNDKYAFVSIRSADLLPNERRIFKFYGSNKMNILKEIKLKKGDFIEFGPPDIMTDKIYYYPYSFEILNHISKK